MSLEQYDPGEAAVPLVERMASHWAVLIHSKKLPKSEALQQVLDKFKEDVEELELAVADIAFDDEEELSKVDRIRAHLELRYLNRRFG